jgi:hypothetical protein
MSDSADTRPFVNNDDSAPADIIWGAAEIGRVINRTPRQTHYLLAAGAIRSARKVSNLWTASRAALRREWSA